ncbi:hypothetical protein QVD17_04021 [Tagetes erecta]|uniref:Uncharacterized protein n=1 Tax=Tagetes erecta TaxID=13708 RepID=A0AAD8L9D8_TARER|nr:hypothetical protein QVD17_04021 [Tagetes erecta]
MTTLTSQLLLCLSDFVLFLYRPIIQRIGAVDSTSYQIVLFLHRRFIEKIGVVDRSRNLFCVFFSLAVGVESSLSLVSISKSFIKFVLILDLLCFIIQALYWLFEIVVFVAEFFCVCVCELVLNV